MEDFLEIIKDSLAEGEDVMISGFGKFCVNEKKSRKGRNPATSQEMNLPARRVVTFKCSGKLRNLINYRAACRNKSTLVFTVYIDMLLP